jgi:hypothetical protein
MISAGLKEPDKIGSNAMKQFLISSLILGFLLGTAPVMADSDQRRVTYSINSGYEEGKAHKKFLTSRFRNDHRYRSDRGNWRGHPGKKHQGWKKGKRHGWKHDYHRQKRHGYNHRNHYDRRSYTSHSYDRRSSYRIHYNGAAVSGGHISIDLSRH